MAAKLKRLVTHPVLAWEIYYVRGDSFSRDKYTIYLNYHSVKDTFFIYFQIRHIHTTLPAHHVSSRLVVEELSPLVQRKTRA